MQMKVPSVFRKALFFCFNLKKTVAGSHRMAAEVYGDRALNELQKVVLL